MSDNAGERFLEDALNETAPIQDDDAPRGQQVQQSQPDLEPPTQPQRQGGLKPMIAQKRKEIIDLEQKMENHEQTGAYQAKGEDGRSYFNYVAMQQDQARLSRLNRELSELRERDREYASTAQNRSRTAIQMAQAFLDRELRGVPEDLKRATGEKFATIFKQLVGNNEFAKSQYADRASIQAVLDQMFNTAYGEAVRNSQTGGAERRNQGAPPPSGFDENEDPRPRENEEDDVDDFTNNLLYAHERRRQGQMTVAEAKRQARAAAAKGASE